MSLFKRNFLLERFAAVCKGKRNQRAVLLTINIIDINGLFIEEFRKQVSRTYLEVTERLCRLRGVDSFMITPGITENGNVHYHTLLIIKESFSVVRQIKTLFSGIASVHWSKNWCHDAGDVNSCLNYMTYENAIPAALKMKRVMWFDLMMLYNKHHEIIEPSPKVVDQVSLTELAEAANAIVRGASPDGDPTDNGDPKYSHHKYKFIDE